MERNWLIRTSQNQILGPVAKEKLLEFIQKGALGLTDEVASGNGYWFALKEKDLVEKYLYGDIPQGYNPISESKSVLARRDNPDKTSSINTSPANATQVIKLSDLLPGIAPKNEDLEFPDLAASVAVNAAAPVFKFEEDDGLKLPAQDDLEFPDVNAIAVQVDQTFKYPGPDGATTVNRAVSTNMLSPIAKIKVVLSAEEVILPNEDDLAFPDMDEHKTSTKVEKGKVDLAQEYTRTVALDEQQAAQVIPAVAAAGAKVQRNLDSDFGEMSLSLDIAPKKAEVKEGPADQAVQKREKPQPSPAPAGDDKKLLHDRKTKSSSKPAAQRDPTREVVHHEVEPLKKRNDNYIFFILIILILIIVAVFFYFKEILNKPLPV